jgi:Flp pilus assembly protein TadD
VAETTSVKFFSNGSSPSDSIESKGAQQARRSFRLNEEGVELIFQGHREDGELKIKQALENDPNNPTAIYNLAGLQLANSNNKEAIRLMERALELRPNDMAFLNRMAEAHFADSNIPQAIRVYELIVSRDPSYGEAMSRLGTLYGMARDWERADRTLERAVEIHPKDARALSNWGNTLVLRGKYAEAKKVLERSQKLKETSENAVALGIACEGLKERKEAVGFYKKAKELGDRDQELTQRLEELEKPSDASSVNQAPVSVK